MIVLTDVAVYISPGNAIVEPPDLQRLSIKFVNDTSKQWYRPNLTREEGTHTTVLLFALACERNVNLLIYLVYYSVWRSKRNTTCVRNGIYTGTEDDFLLQRAILTLATYP